MTVSSIRPVNNYWGNGSNTMFDFDFLIENQNELVVTHVTEEGIKTNAVFGVDYSINEIGNKNGSYIVFPLPNSSFEVLKTGELLSLTLSLEIKQESEFPNSSTLKLDVLEWTLDYIVRILQMLNAELDRTLKVEEGSDATPEQILSNLNETQKNTYLYYSETKKNYEKSIEQANISTQQATIAVNKANEAVKKVNSTLNNNQVTNCILSIEELVKVEPFAQTGSSLLRLKAGSIVYVSTNGTFNEVTIQADVYEGSGGLHTSDSSRELFCCYVPSTNKLVTIPVNETFSQPTAPTTFLAGKYAGWYDTTNKIMKYSYDAGVTWTICSLPFVVGNPRNVSEDGDYGWVNRIKQVFNGYGYVGQYTFTTRGLKYLISDGKNTDKTLKNIEVTTTKLTLKGSSGLSSWLGFLRENGDLVTYGVDYYFEQKERPSNLTNNYATWLNTDENVMYTTSDKGITWIPIKQTLFGDLRKPNPDGNITVIVPNKPVELVKTADLSIVINNIDNKILTLTNNVTSLLMPDYTAGISITWDDLTEYTAPIDGVVMFEIYPQGNRSALLIAVNGVQIPVNINGPSADADTTCALFFVSKGDVVTKGNTGAPREFTGAFYPLKGAK